MRLILAASLLLSASITFAQEHRHPPQDVPLHEDFYSGWPRKHIDLYPNISGCCNSGDCYPTKAQFRRGGWFALRREDQKWVPIPDAKVDYGRTPDGRAHLCAPGPGTNFFAGDFIWCFRPGEGGA